MTPERAITLYRRLGRLLAETPDIRETYASADTQMWIGRVTAIVTETANFQVLAQFNTVKSTIGYMNFNQGRFMLSVYDVLAELENSLPQAEAHPTFLPAGSPYDAHRIIAEVISGALESVLLVDRYLRDSVIARFAPSVRDGVTLRLLTTAQGRASLLPAIEAWNLQHGPQVEIEARQTSPKHIHDRLIIVDGAKAWTLTQSFHDIADVTPAEIIANESNVEEKVEAYEDVWSAATALV